MDIDSLIHFGEIKIIWTTCMADHLELDLGGARDDDSASSYESAVTGTTLKIFWFDAYALSDFGS